MRQAALHFIDQIEYRNVGKVPGGLLYEIGRTMDGRDDDRGRDTCEKRNRNGNPKPLFHIPPQRGWEILKLWFNM